MKNINLLIKPASSLCNMRCKYCFYADESANRENVSTGVMTTETADAMIRDAFAAVSFGGTVNFTFQGGEPTLAGLPFFRSFVKKVKEENTKKIRVVYGIQTNGLVVDEAWADFFSEHDFLVGVSVDGEQFIHDDLRKDAHLAPTWEKVTESLKLLQEKRVRVNLLCVVTRQCARRGEKIYRSLCALNGEYLQFIPCLDPIGQKRGGMDWSLTPELYGKFLCAVFDLWYQDWKAGRYVSVRLFDDYVHLMMGLPAGTCATGGSCGEYLVVEGDGSLYPCDFYCLDEWKIGEIGKMTLTEALQSDVSRRFLREGDRHPAECADCRYVRLCHGGCKRDWETEGAENHNYFCSAFRRFFAYAEERLTEIAAAERQAVLGKI